MKIAFDVYGHGSISHEGIKRYLRREIAAINGPRRNLRSPQRMLAYAQYFVNCSGINRDRELTKMVFEGWELTAHPTDACTARTMDSF